MFEERRYNGVPNDFRNDVRDGVMGLRELSQREFLIEFFEPYTSRNMFVFLCEDFSRKNSDFVETYGRSWFQKAIPVTRAVEKITQRIEQTDAADFFLTTSVFSSRAGKPERTNSSVFAFRSIVADLDYYKTKHKDLTPEKIWDVLNERFFKTNIIPTPTKFVHSGGGVYLIWDLNFTPSKFEKMRVGILDRLEYHLKEFGFDSNAKDAAHVFRFAGTTNTKQNGDISRNGTSVRAFAVGDVEPYSITALINQLQKTAIEKPKPKTKPKPAKVTPIEFNPKHKFNGRYSRLINDLFKLAEIRNIQADTYRERLCFMVRNFYHQANRGIFEGGNAAEIENLFAESLNLAKSINAMFAVPLEEKEVQQATKTEKRLYPFKNITIIKELEITYEESLEMIELVYNEKQTRTRKTLNESNRRMKQGAKNRQLLYARIEKCIKENPKWTDKQIGEVIKCHRTTVSKVRKPLK
jgi:hypothetical protein